MVYGDAASPAVLDAAGVVDARLLLVTVPAAVDVELIVRRARNRNPGLRIVARSQYLAQMEKLRAFGVDEPVQPESEAGLEIIRQALSQMDVPDIQIQLLTHSVRRDLYQPLQSQHADSQLIERLRNALRHLEVEWFTLSETSRLLGQSSAQADIRLRTGDSVVSIMRRDKIFSIPDPYMTFESGDVLES